RPGGPDGLGDPEQDLFPLDRARACDHRQMPAADADALDLDDRVLLAEISAGELEGLEDRDDLLDAVDGRERLGLELVLVADDSDDRPGDPLAEVGREAQLLDPPDDVLDLLWRRMRLQHDDHRPLISRRGASGGSNSVGS